MRRAARRRATIVGTRRSPRGAAPIVAAPLELTIDLSLDRRPAHEDGDRRSAGLHELTEAARRPAELARLLWGNRYDRVRVLYEPRPSSLVRAGALGIATLARTRDLVVENGSGGELTRAAGARRAAAGIARALAEEGLRGRALRRRARRQVRHPFAIPREPVRARDVVYLRTDASLRWMGAYVGGSATHTSGVLNGLSQNGVSVHLLATERPPDADVAAFTAVPVKRVYHLTRWLTPVDYSAEVVSAAASTRPDFVYQRYALGSTAGVELASRLRVPLVLEYNGSEVWAERNWGNSRIWRAEELAEIEERNLRDSSLIVVVSEALRDELRERGIEPERVLVNPNGVDVGRLAHIRERSPSEWRTRTGQTEAPTIGFVGTFGLWHGVKLLPDMVAGVAKQTPDARWILIGDGPLRVEVRDELEARGLLDRVLIPGVVPHERAIELLGACDVCVSPHVPNPDGSRFFGSPTKLFEYMGLRRPIVASDLEQIGEVIEHERTGLLCPPGDAGAATAAVVRLLGDADLRERLAAAALAEAEASYTWESHVRRILDRLGD
jgi:glycosyltransferase involved in cell wall biosynthesis